MKIRYKASEEQTLYFTIYAIFLLYIVAVGVLNINSFAVYGKFRGLNPFPAFGPAFIVETLAFYLFFLCISILGTSMIEFEDGFGFIKGKKEEKGYSRWFNEKEMKEADYIKKINIKDEHYEAAGIPVINNGTEAWVDDGEYHSMIIGASGSGKTQCIMHTLIKILTKKGESMVVTDPKGELFEESADMMKKRGYKVILINFRDPKYGEAWNPFSLPYRLYKEGNTDKAKELLEDLASNILYDPNNKAEPFWEKSAADYFTGLSLGLFDDAEEDQVNLNSINYMSTVGEERIGASNFLKEYFTSKGELSGAYISASATINAPQDTKGSILSVFRQKIRIFSSRDQLSEMLSRCDFDMRDIGRQKTAVFLKIHDEKTTYHALATIFVKQVYESLIDVAQEQPGLKLKYRTNFVLDEFANMPPLKDVETMVTASRSRNIRFSFVIQNYSQLTKVYGKDIAETIKGNCGNIVFLITTELAALEEISKLCGDVKPSKPKEGMPAEPIRPLVTVSDLQQMKQFEVLIKRFRNQPFKTKFTPNFKIDWGEEIVKSTYEPRESKPVDVFDIKEFVLNLKKEQGEQGSPMMNNYFNPQREYIPPFSPFAAQNKTGGGGSDGNINVDDLVKRIDQKIAELEEEEKKEKEELEKNKNVVNTVEEPTSNPLAQRINERMKELEFGINVIEEAKKEEEPEVLKETLVETKEPEIETIEEKESEVTTEFKEMESETLAENPVEMEKPKINIDVDSIVVNDNITDDQFFDDFFGEE